MVKLPYSLYCLFFSFVGNKRIPFPSFRRRAISRHWNVRNEPYSWKYFSNLNRGCVWGIALNVDLALIQLLLKLFVYAKSSSSSNAWSIISHFDSFWQLKCFHYRFMLVFSMKFQQDFFKFVEFEQFIDRHIMICLD